MKDKKKYSWKNVVFDKTDKDAQKFGECVEKFGDNLKPRDVVDAAKSPDSPIHDFFEWNDKKASEKYRLHQARHYLSHLEVVIDVKSGATQKAYFNVEIGVNNERRRAYVVLDKALTEVDYRTQVIQRALDEVAYWEQKYHEYSEFASIFVAIDTTKEKLKKAK
jgi:hypothetical protein